MQIEVSFTGDLIPPQQSHAIGAGAVVEFHGVVRELEKGEKISGIVYEIYEPMAERSITKILRELSFVHPCKFVRLIHRHGVVPVGESSIYVRIEAEHRREAFRMMEQLMDRLKVEVPIWKTGFVPC
jgi:molybdopterin synthase catalytic subunit